jgi:hypothetical protein
MNKGEIALKITNHESVESLLGFASSWLVDLGFVSHAGPTDPAAEDVRRL